MNNLPNMSDIALLKISLQSMNVFSFMVGMFFASNMFWRVRAMNYIVFYLCALATFFYLSSEKIIWYPQIPFWKKILNGVYLIKKIWICSKNGRVKKLCLLQVGSDTTFSENDSHYHSIQFLAQFLHTLWNFRKPLCECFSLSF